jgi:tetratricopeptide (TPR) repeat protein
LLLERAVETAEPAELPRAACYLAMSRVAQGKIESAIGAYQLAIEAERRNPAHRSTAGVDQAFLIALYDRRDHFSQALDQLAMAFIDGWSLAGLEALSAEAIIRQARGETEQARQRADEALQQFPEDAQGAEWAGISFDDLRARLEAIAG